MPKSHDLNGFGLRIEEVAGGFQRLAEAAREVEPIVVRWHNVLFDCWFFWLAPRVVQELLLKAAGRCEP